MTIRNDVSIEWETSPRVITIAAPSTEITIQDLVDTCRFQEELLQNIDNPHLIDAAGKEFLGGTTYVGITATLQNAVLAFEARPGPDWVLCTISGGNLVAVDDNDSVIDPRTPTAFVSVDRTASSSATLQEQSLIQYSAFNGGVWVDLTSSNSGTSFPNGTEQFPVNNYTDASEIAIANGFMNFFLIGDHVISDQADFSNLFFHGMSKTRTHLEILDQATIDNCNFYDMTVEGYLDGYSTVIDCRIESINYVQGCIDSCVLDGGGITLLGDAILLDCYSGNPDSGIPEVNMDGAGKSLTVKNYNGNLRIKNKSGDDPIEIDLSSGEIIIDATVTAGDIVVRGVGKVTNNSSLQIETSDLLSPTSIASAVWTQDNIGTDIVTSFERIARILGLVQENYYLDNTVYHESTQGQKLLQSGRIRIYNTAAQVGTDSGVSGMYEVAATYTDDELTTYSVKKVTETTTTTTTSSTTV